MELLSDSHRPTITCNCLLTDVFSLSTAYCQLILHCLLLTAQLIVHCLLLTDTVICQFLLLTASFVLVYCLLLYYINIVYNCNTKLKSIFQVNKLQYCCFVIVTCILHSLFRPVACGTGEGTGVVRRKCCIVHEIHSRRSHHATGLLLVTVCIYLISYPLRMTPRRGKGA